MLEIQAKYQEALEAKTRKEGEVSILRKTIEKVRGYDPLLNKLSISPYSIHKSILPSSLG